MAPTTSYFAQMLKDYESEKQAPGLFVPSIPNVNLGTARAGEALLADAVKSGQYLSSAAVVNVSTLEQLGALLKWWRIVEQSYAIAGIFAHLRSMLGKKKNRIQDRYARAITRLKLPGSSLSFSHASKYDRLGRFLLAFPRFVHQTQIATLSEWLQPVAGSAMLDWVQAGHLGEEKMAFWKSPIEVEDVFSVPLERQVCKGLCLGCSGLFPGLCEGVSRGREMSTVIEL